MADLSEANTQALPPNEATAGGRSAPPAYHSRCDCPCHRGTEVFHIVSCCGSVLGRGQRAMRLRSGERAGVRE